MTPPTVIESADRLASGAVTSRELVRDAIAAADAWEPTIRSLLARRTEEALEEADAADAERGRGTLRGPLHGVPIVVKDLIDVAGSPTTAGSRVLAGNVAVADATVVARLRAAGAIVLAKSNTHEFGFGALTPPTNNPWAAGRMPGGSSGGTAAAVAAGIVAAGLGTDSAGSVREPAALCGVVGLKPTLGLVPSTGIYQLTTTMSAVGPMTRDVPDAAVMLRAMRGDTASSREPWWQSPPDPRRLRGLRVGVMTDLSDPVRDEVNERLGALVDALAETGADVRPSPLFDLEVVNAAAFLTLGAEALSLHQSWLDSRGEDYTPGVRSYLEMARLYSAADYVDAQRLRTIAMDGVEQALADFDVLIGPSQLTVAPTFDQQVVEFPGGRTLPRDLALVRPLLPFSFTGHPAVVVPGWLVDGLPVGFQLVGRHGTDERLLAAAREIQALTPWPEQSRLPASPRSPDQSSSAGAERG